MTTYNEILLKAQQIDENGALYPTLNIDDTTPLSYAHVSIARSFVLWICSQVEAYDITNYFKSVLGTSRLYIKGNIEFLVLETMYRELANKIASLKKELEAYQEKYQFLEELYTSALAVDEALLRLRGVMNKDTNKDHYVQSVLKELHDLDLITTKTHKRYMAVIQNLDPCMTDPSILEAFHRMKQNQIDALSLLGLSLVDNKTPSAEAALTMSLRLFKNEAYLEQVNLNAEKALEAFETLKTNQEWSDIVAGLHNKPIDPNPPVDPDPPIGPEDPEPEDPVNPPIDPEDPVDPPIDPNEPEEPVDPPVDPGPEEPTDPNPPVEPENPPEPSPEDPTADETDTPTIPPEEETEELVNP